MAEEKVPLIDWGVLSFVENEEISQCYLLDFFAKLNELLRQAAELKLLSLNFSESPVFVKTVAVNNFVELKHTVKQLRNQFTSCIVLFCILPKEDSEEWGWIKQISKELGFARQCILRENVETFFKTCSAPVPDVCDNISTWLCTRIGQIAHGPRYFKLCFTRYYNPHSLQITKPNNYFEQGTAKNDSEKQNNLESQTKLNSFKHSFAEDELVISGFPPNYSEFQVAGILHEFRVKNVEIAEDDEEKRVAYIQLGSKFEVMQACRNFDEKLINETFVVKLVPNNEFIRQKFESLYR